MRGLPAGAPPARPGGGQGSPSGCPPRGAPAGTPGARCARSAGCRSVLTTRRRSSRWPRPQSVPAAAVRQSRERVQDHPPNVVTQAGEAGHAGARPPWTPEAELPFHLGKLHGGCLLLREQTPADGTHEGAGPAYSTAEIPYTTQRDTIRWTEGATSGRACLRPAPPVPGRRAHRGRARGATGDPRCPPEGFGDGSRSCCPMRPGGTLLARPGTSRRVGTFSGREPNRPPRDLLGRTPTGQAFATAVPHRRNEPKRPAERSTTWRVGNSSTGKGGSCKFSASESPGRDAQ